MRWELSEEQSDYRTVLREWLQDRSPVQDVRRMAESGDPTPFERSFVSDGWFGVGAAEDLGGQGGGLVELALTAEELGRAAAPCAAWLGSMLAVPVLAATPEAAKPLLTEGSVTVLAVPSDRTADSRPSVVVDGASVVGSVPSVLGADRARRLVVPARSGTGRALVLVDREAPGVEIRRRSLVDSTRSVADVSFSGVAGVLLDGSVDDSLRAATLRSAVLVAADALGAADRMLEMTVEYSLQRQQFGVPIGSFQAVKHAAATMLVAVESARSIVYLAAAAVEQGRPEAETLVSAAKAQVTEGAWGVAESALTLHGAIGYTWEHDLQFFYKRAALDRVLFGTPARWNDRLADALELVPQG